MDSLYDYDVYVFDCDGVILDSNELKNKAFRETLARYPKEEVDQFILYHKKNGGVSRYKKFEYFFKEILTVDDKKEKTDEAIKDYGSLVKQRLLNCNLIEGVDGFLKSLITNKKACYVDSGSDESELRGVFKERNLDKFFKQIYGSPTSKVDNLKKIFSTHSKEEKIIFFGDSLADYQAAKHFDIDFYYIDGVSEWKNPKGNFAYQSKNFNL